MQSNHRITLTLFAGLPSDLEYNLSRIPCSWRLLYLLLCFIGVNNVFFIKPLPRPLRIASLVYHAAWLCMSVPTMVWYMHNLKWGRSVNDIIHHVGLIIYGNYLITSGTLHMINALRPNRTVKILKKWCVFCSDKTVCCVKENNKSYRTFRVSLVIICAALITWYVVAVVQYALVFDWSICTSRLFPSLHKSPWLLKAMCVNYHILLYLSAFSVVLTACYFAFFTLTLGEEYNKLYRIICNYASSPSTDIGTREQVRFRHEALFSLVCLHAQLSTMLLGLILVGDVVYLCFTFYYVLTINADILGVLNAIVAIAVLLTIIAPSNMLENEISKISTKHTKVCINMLKFCISYFQLHWRKH